MINPQDTVFFIPPKLSPFKMNLFERIGRQTGGIIRGDFNALARAAESKIPIVGCTPELRPLIDDWVHKRRTWVYWDRGYCDRVFATSLPTGDAGGYYRWHVNAYQMQRVKPVSPDRWDILKASNVIKPWQTQGSHIVVAAPSITYSRFHRTENWIAETIKKLATITGRQLVIRDKEHVKTRHLTEDLKGAHALVTHGSNTAVEAAMLGCPVFVDKSSAAALIGKTNLDEIEKPAYPDREPWLRSLAYCQFSEPELVDGTLWKLLD